MTFNVNTLTADFLGDLDLITDLKKKLPSLDNEEKIQTFCKGVATFHLNYINPSEKEYLRPVSTFYRLMNEDYGKTKECNFNKRKT